MSDPVAERGAAFIRGHTRADLRFEENVRPIKYVVHPDGRIVAPAMVAMLQSVDTVLFVPEWIDGAMELQVTLEEFQERGENAACADRWRIYHGEPDDVRWAFFRVDAARFENLIIDGEAVRLENPLVDHEARLCRMMNKEQPQRLRHLVDQHAGMMIEDPVLVGIDPMGVDVRARFDVVRIEAASPMTSVEQAERVLQAMSQPTRA